MGLDTYFELIYQGVTVFIMLFILDLIFYKFVDLRPVIFRFGTDFEKCKWTFDEVGLKYKVLTHENGDKDICSNHGCIAFNEKGRLKECEK